MGHYYNHMKVRNLARMCSIQAQANGVVLVKQALPLREICKEHAVSTTLEVLMYRSMKQATQSFKGWMAGSLHRMRKSNTDGNGKESCGMSQVANVDQRVPEALNKFQVESEKVRHHFHDDPRALKIWDEYIEDVHIASSRNLRYLLCTYTQKSGLYEQLMRKSCTNTSVSMSSSVGMLSGLYVKLKQATRNTRVPIAVVVASVADAFAMGVGTQRSNLWKQQHGKETWR